MVYFLLLPLIFSSSQLVDSVHVKPIEDVVREFGYPIETHTIKTTDGYLLTYHRLPHGKAGPGSGSGTPVLFVNGVLASSATVLTKENGLGYLLADAGLDVWLANYRGNLYSRRHSVLNPDMDKQFWNYTLHDFGTGDLPAAIDYILDLTSYEQLLYIGFSMGTTMFWILGASEPEYLSKVTAMVAIAPVARPSNCWYFYNLPRYHLIRTVMTGLWAANFNEYLPYGQTWASNFHAFCTKSRLQKSCRRILILYNNIMNQGMDVDSSLREIPYSPAGVSTNILLHYIQIAKAGRFQQYDYGSNGNRELYHTDQPPEYNLKAITIPVFFIYSDRDEVASPLDVEWLARRLPKRPPRLLQGVKHFRHIDFVLNHNLARLLSEPLTAFVKHLAEEGVNRSSEYINDFII